MGTWQNGVQSIDGLSSRSKLPYCGASIVSHVSIPAPSEKYPAHRPDFWRPSRGAILLSNDGEFKCRLLLRGCDFLYTFFTCLFLGLLLQRFPRCFDGLAFIVFLCCSHLPWSSSSDFTLCAKLSKDEFWCFLYQR